MKLGVPADTPSKSGCVHTPYLQMHGQRHLFMSEFWFYNTNNSDAKVAQCTEGPHLGFSSCGPHAI